MLEALCATKLALEGQVCLIMEDSKGLSILMDMRLNLFFNIIQTGRTPEFSEGCLSLTTGICGHPSSKDGYNQQTPGEQETMCQASDQHSGSWLKVGKPSLKTEIDATIVTYIWKSSHCPTDPQWRLNMVQASNERGLYWGIYLPLGRLFLH